MNTPVNKAHSLVTRTHDNSLISEAFSCLNGFAGKASLIVGLATASTAALSGPVAPHASYDIQTISVPGKSSPGNVSYGAISHTVLPPKAPVLPKQEVGKIDPLSVSEKIRMAVAKKWDSIGSFLYDNFKMGPHGWEGRLVNNRTGNIVVNPNKDLIAGETYILERSREKAETFSHFRKQQFAKNDEQVKILQKIAQKKSGTVTIEKKAPAFGIKDIFPKIEVPSTIVNFPTSTIWNGGVTSGTELVEKARNFIGMRYSLGGNGDGKIDCSGLINESMRLAGVLQETSPRLTTVYYKSIIKKTWVKDYRNITAGDIIYTPPRRKGGYAHIRIASGSLVNGKIPVIHASGSRKRVVEELIVYSPSMVIGSLPWVMGANVHTLASYKIEPRTLLATASVQEDGGEGDSSVSLDNNIHMSTVVEIEESKASILPAQILPVKILPVEPIHILPVTSFQESEKIIPKMQLSTELLPRDKFPTVSEEPASPSVRAETPSIHEAAKRVHTPNVVSSVREIPEVILASIPKAFEGQMNTPKSEISPSKPSILSKDPLTVWENKTQIVTDNKPTNENVMLSDASIEEKELRIKLAHLKENIDYYRTEAKRGSVYAKNILPGLYERFNSLHLAVTKKENSRLTATAIAPVHSTVQTKVVLDTHTVLNEVAANDPNYISTPKAKEVVSNVVKVQSFLKTKPHLSELEKRLLKETPQYITQIGQVENNIRHWAERSQKGDSGAKETLVKLQLANGHLYKQLMTGYADYFAAKPQNDGWASAKIVKQLRSVISETDQRVEPLKRSVKDNEASLQLMRREKQISVLEKARLEWIARIVGWVAQHSDAILGRFDERRKAA